MKATTLAVILIILGMFALQDADAGFGCPFKPYKCDRHCKHIWCRFGYCDIKTFYIRCTCADCRRYDDMEIIMADRTDE
ncbi:hemocyte defensin Cg-Defh1-like [Mercenaria mercenaria]|uniref:hemocyte defensin Cg-Defh1-like n=1 Tax=Mercenaria mercenaria TaxID=6596 RepID=UPI00234F376A|nr:hemocyte defensin Cg-Defh1-like [Mercenaria mercenaria]